MTDKEVVKELNGIRELLLDACADEKDKRRLIALTCAITKMTIHSKNYGGDIELWDEVHSETYDLTWIVTRITKNGTDTRYEGICSDGACYESLPDDIEKTGRFFPELAAVLERMNEDD